MNKLRKVWERIQEMARAPMSDETSWVAHWVVVAASTGVIAGVLGTAIGHGVLWGVLVSEAWLIYFVGREVANYLTHEAAAHDMRRWTKDGIMDLVGPLLHHILWWTVYLV
jgi:hypothetical protein